MNAASRSYGFSLRNTPILASRFASVGWFLPHLYSLFPLPEEIWAAVTNFYSSNSLKKQPQTWICPTAPYMPTHVFFSSFTFSFPGLSFLTHCLLGDHYVCLDQDEEERPLLFPSSFSAGCSKGRKLVLFIPRSFRFVQSPTGCRC